MLAIEACLIQRNMNGSENPTDFSPYHPPWPYAYGRSNPYDGASYDYITAYRLIKINKENFRNKFPLAPKGRLKDGFLSSKGYIYNLRFVRDMAEVRQISFTKVADEKEIDYFTYWIKKNVPDAE